MDAKTKTDLLQLVSSHEAGRLWSQIEPYIQAANNFAGGKFDTKHWLIKVLAEQADLWVTPELTTVLVGEPLQYPAARIYSISLAGGEGGDDWVAHERQIATRARLLGCEAIENLARPGWRKVAKQCGYSVAHYVYRKEL